MGTKNIEKKTLCKYFNEQCFSNLWQPWNTMTSVILCLRTWMLVFAAASLTGHSSCHMVSEQHNK